MKKGWKLLLIPGIVLLILIAILTYVATKKFYHGTKIEVISLRLNWIPDPTFTGSYVAKFKGFWSKRGLEVEIKSGGYQINPIQLVASGKDQFGIAGADRLLYAVSNKLPIKAIAVMFKQNSVGWIVRADSDIREPRDFEGHAVAMKYGEESEAIFYALMKKYEVNLERIKKVPVEYSLNPFFMNIVDAFPVYMNEEPHRARDKGVEIRIINPADFGIQLYGNVLFTSVNLINKNPELVQKFLNGYIEGWEYARNNPGAAAELLEENVPEMDKPTIRRVLNSTLEFLEEKGVKSKIGSMTKIGWQKTMDVLVTYGELDKNINLDDVYDDRFINRLIQNYK